MAHRAVIPEEVADYLGDNYERKLLEPVLEQMVLRQRLSVARAGEILGLDRWESAQRWTDRGHGYPNFSQEKLERELDALADLIPPNRP